MKFEKALRFLASIAFLLASCIDKNGDKETDATPGAPVATTQAETVRSGPTIPPVATVGGLPGPRATVTPDGRKNCQTLNCQSTSLLPASPLGLANPMPHGRIYGYAEDSGLDIMGDSLKVYAVAPGKIVYSEKGHTSWNRPPDTPNSILLELSSPLPFKKRLITHIFYTHLSILAFYQAEGSSNPRYVNAGEYLGVSGIGGGSPHLHIGFLLDGNLSQRDGTFLDYLDIREALGNLKENDILPAN